MVRLTAALLATCGGAGVVVEAQFPPRPEGITILKSRFHENVTISYKEPKICETTPGVRSYSGYVHLPPGFLDDDDGPGGEKQDYPINTFFWFFEARKNASNAPLSIWLNGGPGASSMMGLLEENGPCFVGPDSKTTHLNPWSWNEAVNMLYIDQPTQAGFSYDELVNGTAVLDPDKEGFVVTPVNFSGGVVPTPNATFHVGTFSSQKPYQTADSTARAAHAFWHFAQTWFREFPHYRPRDDRISLWGESYGGHYGPAFFRFLKRQNEKIAIARRRRREGDGDGGDVDVDVEGWEKDAQYLHLDTLGIVNGLLDMVIQHESYITFPYNNVIFNQSLHDELMHNWTRPDGCKAKAQRCQDSMKDKESRFLSAENLTGPCDEAALICSLDAWIAYQGPGHDSGWYDIAHPRHDPFPLPHMYGYLREESVLKALGVPVNYTSDSGVTAAAFARTYDFLHGGYLDAVAELLDSGLKVHLVYGDRDYACNWFGGEAASLAVPWKRREEFEREAGYAPLLILSDERRKGEKRMAGLTRQLGNFSFTRVFQAGHEVPSYDPAAASAIFNRATFHRDIATGLQPTTDELVTRGPRDVRDVTNEIPPVPKRRCYVLKPATCTPEVWAKVERGEVLVRDWFVVEDDEQEDVGEL
ncbi:carboxypeptidase C [Xylariaceae sp. FL0594]|nr:carboxypeptidase C [Xylariaceae sp. FL0594]